MMKSRTITKMFRVLSVLLAFLLMYLSLARHPEGESLVKFFPLQDKGAHAFAYAAFGFSLFFAFNGKSRQFSWRPFLQTLLLGAVFGYTMEIIQGFVGRDYDLLDLLADCIGIVSGILISLAILYLYRHFFCPGN